MEEAFLMFEPPNRISFSITIPLYAVHRLYVIDGKINSEHVNKYKDDMQLRDGECHMWPIVMPTTTDIISFEIQLNSTKHNGSLSDFC